jgi:hypothetical protein
MQIDRSERRGNAVGRVRLDGSLIARGKSAVTNP